MEIVTIYQKYCLKIVQKKCGPHLFITAYFYEASVNLIAALPFLYQELNQILRKENAVVVLERWFGSDKELDLGIRELQPVDDKTQLRNAVTPINGNPCYATKDSPCTGFAGMQIEAVVPSAGVSVPEFIFDEQGCVAGRQWKEGKARFIILQNLWDSDLSHSRTEQTAVTLRLAEQLLKNESMTYQDVARTWIYLDDILSWYDSFNEVRNVFYREIGIMPAWENTSVTPASECYLPASTGIRGRSLSQAACTIDLIASQIPDDSGFRVQRLTNRKQKDAFRYGAAFARASVIENDEYAEVQISGTAAINEKGDSILLRDVEAQIRYTLDTIETLIEEAGFKLTDICTSTAFIKHEEDLPLFLDILKEKGLENLPVVICKADVCRDNLLFELDGIAGRNKIKTEKL